MDPGAVLGFAELRGGGAKADRRTEGQKDGREEAAKGHPRARP